MVLLLIQRQNLSQRYQKFSNIFVGWQFLAKKCVIRILFKYQESNENKKIAKSNNFYFLDNQPYGNKYRFG